MLQPASPQHAGLLLTQGRMQKESLHMLHGRRGALFGMI